MRVSSIIGGQILAAQEGAVGSREVLFYAGTPVLRVDNRNQVYHLSFSMEPDSIDLSRLNSGRAPFVVDHLEDVDHTIGVIEKAWMGDGARASVRFSARDEMQGLIRDIESGVLANVSMAAEVLEPVKGPSIEKGIPHVMAAKWRPLHISVVARGADHNAQFLSDRMDIPDGLLSLSADAGAASAVDRARYLIQLQRIRFEAGL